MHFPVFNCDHKGWQSLEKGVESLKSLVGPIYFTDSKYHFNEIEKHLEKLKPNLLGPVYKLEDRHFTYDIVPEHKSGEESLTGPIYNLPENQHHFHEILKHVSDLKELAGPVSSISFVSCFICKTKNAGIFDLQTLFFQNLG